MKRISIETSHPLWIVKMLSKQYDLNIAKKICQHDNTPPTRAARVNILKTTKAQLLTDENFEAGIFLPMDSCTEQEILLALIILKTD